MFYIELEVEEIVTEMEAFMKDNGITYEGLDSYGINFPNYRFLGEKMDLENFIDHFFPEEPEETKEAITEIDPAVLNIEARNRLLDSLNKYQFSFSQIVQYVESVGEDYDWTNYEIEALYPGEAVKNLAEDIRVYFIYNK